MSHPQNQLLLTYYGDDFTGSTDALESLTLGGLRTVLFLSPPQPEQLQGRFAGVQALGVAGVGRTMTPEQMERDLRPVLAQLKQLGAPLCHYKVCSTFDSSPELGSIGRAADIGRDVFAPPFIPLVVGAPALRRYVVFGNLFAGVGDETFRLDRHPTMSRHPVTPMAESDLRRHLSHQTRQSIGLLDVVHLSGSPADVDAHFARLRQNGAEMILFDTLDATHLPTVGRLIWENRGNGPLFIVGSSGVGYALTAYWRQIKLIARPAAFSAPGRAAPIVVMSGSAAPPTAAQIEWALAHGFDGIRLDAAKLVTPELAGQEQDSAVRQALAALEAGRSVILYTAFGPDDPAIQAAREQMRRLGFDESGVGRRLGIPQGKILRALVEKSGVRRVCVAGGDTSGYVARQLGIYALEVLAPVSPGAPLCRASSDESGLDGLEISLKGGQMGSPDYFGRIQEGNV